MADPSVGPDFTTWLMRLATHPSWWLRWWARGMLLFLGVGVFYGVMGLIDQNWESPGRVLGRIFQTAPPYWIGVGALGITFVVVGLIYLTLLLLWRAHFGLGRFARTTASRDVTVVLTGVEARGEVGSVVPSIEGRGTVTPALPPPIRVVTAPRLPERFLRGAARAIYIDPYQVGAYRRLHPSLMDPRGGSEADMPPTLRGKKQG